MTGKRAFTVLAAAGMTMGLVACGGAPEGEATEATAEAPPIIKERQDNFEKIGDSFKAIRGQLESGAPDMAVVTEAAKTMNASALKIEGHFPAGTSIDDGFDTEALATIWEKPEEFAEATKMLVDASAEMVTIAEGGDAAAVGEQAKNVGKSCGNCHDNFRVKKD